MILFSEDNLTEVLARRLVRELNPRIEITAVMGNRGFTQFERSLPSIIRSSQGGVRFLVLIDGDVLNPPCAGQAIMRWFGQYKPNNICIRIAYQEAENWVLADRQGVAAALNIAPNAIPIISDDTTDAKELLVRLARRSSNRAVRDDMVPQYDDKIVGPGYNARLSEFVAASWSIENARAVSASLDRACVEIEGL